MKAEIISIGTELLLGQITDTNAAYLASELPLLGIDLYWITQVGDNRSRLVDALRRACERSDIVITTGGLGPTEDDVTREAIAELLGEEMTVDPEIEQWIRDMFQKMDIDMPECNIRQANLIPSARAIINLRGTAPGWWVEHENRIILTMPGPPSEMQQMWEREIKPELKKRLSGDIIVSRTVKTLGLTEARVDEMVTPLLHSTNPTLAVYAKLDGIHLRLTAKHREQAKARELIAQAEEQLSDILGQYIWGFDEDTLESIIGSMLRQKMLSLATMESCTGGLLASTITDVPGSSDYFKGGLVAYSAEMKATFGVDDALLAEKGTVASEVAAAMAQAARLKLKADIGIGITGVAGPAELEWKTAGTVHIAIDADGKVSSLSTRFPPRRQEVKRRAVFAALFILRQLLIDWK
ncbi:MAG TPA: competence/damage-inducible protein A [Dehalococcoidia bacterium]|nr:competence/damage-inducible protein A [Dehalococcoidia bacterium]